jgi:hypothetical protein
MVAHGKMRNLRNRHHPRSGGGANVRISAMRIINSRCGLGAVFDWVPALVGSGRKANPQPNFPLRVFITVDLLFAAIRYGRIRSGQGSRKESNPSNDDCRP